MRAHDGARWGTKVHDGIRHFNLGVPRTGANVALDPHLPRCCLWWHLSCARAHTPKHAPRGMCRSVHHTRAGITRLRRGNVMRWGRWWGGSPYSDPRMTMVVQIHATALLKVAWLRVAMAMKSKVWPRKLNE